MTKREKYEAIREMVKDNAEYVEFLNKEIARLETRGEKAKAKRTEKAAENAEAARAAIVKALEDAGRAVTLAELAVAADMTAAKVVYYTRGLVDEGRVVKEPVKIDKRKIMTYRVVAE